MKKIKYLFALVIVAMLTSGCVKYNGRMDIKKDKSMEFSVIYALDKSMFTGETALKEEKFEGLKKNGYTITKYSDDKYEGFTISKSIKNIDEVSSESDVVFNLSGMLNEQEVNNKEVFFKVQKGSDKNTYTANFKFDSNDSNLNTQEKETTDETKEDEELPDIVDFQKEDVANYVEEDDADKKESVTSNSLDSVLTTGEEDQTTVSEDGTTSDGSNLDLSGLNSLTSSMDLTFKVNLPNPAISSNATTKENGDKSLTWNLTSSGKQNIEFTFELDNNASSGNMMLYIGIGAAVLVVILLAVVLLSRKKKDTPVVSAPVDDKPADIPNNNE